MTLKNFLKKLWVRILVGVILSSVIFLSGFLAGSIQGNKITPEELQEIALEDRITPEEFEEIEIQNILTELENRGIIIKVEDGINFPPQEFIRWLTEIKETTTLLSDAMLSQITNNSCGEVLKITFEEKDSDYAGSANYFDNEIFINIISKPPAFPLPFESIGQDGYKSNEEIHFLLIHEMGHIWDFNTNPEITISYLESYQEILEKEESPSLYAYWSGRTISSEDIPVIMTCFKDGSYVTIKREINQDSPAIRKIEDKLKLVNRCEDFAESFSYYVLLPEYFKENFPLRYNWFKENIFNNAEHESVPSSETTRLTKPLIKKDD